MDDRERTRPSPKTREEERREAKDAADAGREPTPEEEEAADSNEPDEEVAEHYEEMTERGAKQRGEGRVSPELQLTGGSQSFERALPS